MSESNLPSTRVVPPFCNPDHPPKKYGNYPRNFDMIDLAEHLDYWPAMRERLRLCSEILWPAYDKADRVALRHQQFHRILTMATTLLGTLAVILAIVQLALPPEFVYDVGPNLTVLEAGSAVAAALAVVLIGVTVKFRWQLGRHQAERLRQLKFGFVVNPETWSGDDALTVQADKLRAAVKIVAAMTSSQYRAWAAEPDTAERPLIPRACPLDDDTLDQLVAYYRAKRLVFQKLYFDDRSKRNNAADWVTGRIAPILFFGSVACVLVHFILDRFPDKSNPHELGRFFIFGAVALPTIGAGIRFFFAAHEFARNKVRYRTKEVGLTHLDEVLQRSSGADAKLRDMDFCEHILALEHREWSGLMIETEVYP